MRLSELYRRWTELSPQQQKDVFGLFIGYSIDDLDGWIDAKERPNYPHAQYVLHNLEEAFAFVKKQTDPKYREPEPMFEPPQTCHDCGKQVYPLDANKTTSPESIGNWSNIDGQIRCPACFSAFIQPPLKCETVYQAPNHPPQIEIVPGALSTAGPDFSLIPVISLERLAERFQLGEERKGDKAWNAHSKNQHILLSKKFLIARLNHVIHHSFKLINKLSNDLPFDSDDDAAAIMWGGCFAIAATDALTKDKADVPF